MLEEEIQKQWDIKAEKNNLSVLNVKNILKVRESLLRLNFDLVIVSREGSSALLVIQKSWSLSVFRCLMPV